MTRKPRDSFARTQTHRRRRDPRRSRDRCRIPPSGLMRLAGDADEQPRRVLPGARPSRRCFISPLRTTWPLRTGHAAAPGRLPGDSYATPAASRCLRSSPPPRPRSRSDFASGTRPGAVSDRSGRWLAMRRALQVSTLQRHHGERRSLRPTAIPVVPRRRNPVSSRIVAAEKSACRTLRCHRATAAHRVPGKPESGPSRGR